MTLDDNSTLKQNNQYSTEPESPHQSPNNEWQKTTGQLIRELSKLVLQLIWVILKKILRVTVKGILFVIQAIDDGITRWRIFWNDNDTQQKVAKTKQRIRICTRITIKWLKLTATLTAKWTIIIVRHAVKYTVQGIKLTILGIIWTAHHIVTGIIHMKPTIIKLWELTCTGVKAFKRGCIRANRGRKLSNIRRRRNYEAFARNGGIKGMLNRWRTSLTVSIQNYMDEEQEEAHPDAVTEDDIIEEEIESTNKAHVIGKRLFTSVKSIVDVDDEDPSQKHSHKLNTTK